MRLRFLSWNMGGGFHGKGRSDAWEYILGQNADVVFVQESFLPKGIHSLYPFIQIGGNGGSAILSKLKFIKYVKLGNPNEDLVYAISSLLLGRNAAGTYSLGGRDSITLSSFHSPGSKVDRAMLPTAVIDAIEQTPGERKNQRKFWKSSVLGQALVLIPSYGRKFVIGGDLSESRMMEQTRGDTEHPWFAWLGENGLVDCFHKFHKVDQRTWFKKGHPPYQLDYFFCDKETAKKITKAPWVDPVPAEKGLSDHAPVFMELVI